jgi:hypothetical protein
LVGDVQVCDGCFDRRIATLTAFPRLPDPTPAVVLSGADGRRHHLRFRIWRAPTGIEVQLDEAGKNWGGALTRTRAGTSALVIQDRVQDARTAAEVVELFRRTERHGDE